MASLPMHDLSSGPEINPSQSETVPESILVLRVVHDLVLPLRLPSPWAEELSPCIGFAATTHLTEPQTVRSHKIRLSVQPSFEKETVKTCLFSGSIPAEGTWRASLYEGDALRASVRFDKSQIELDRAMAPDTYTVNLERTGSPVLRFVIAIGPFSLPETLESVPPYIRKRQYIRAGAVLSDAAKQYPKNADIEDLLVLTETIANADPEALEREQAGFGIMRSKGVAPRRAGELLRSAMERFGERMALVFSSRAMNSEAIPDEVVRRIAHETASRVVVEVAAMLKTIVQGQTIRDEVLFQAIDGVSKRLDEMNDLRRHLNSQIDLARHETGKSDDEKFEEIKKALESFGAELRRRNLRVADYGDFFAKALGDSCWGWLSDDVKKIFIESEDHYRHALSRPLEDMPDFTAGLLDLYRGLELLLNERLGPTTAYIGRMILADNASMQTVGKVLPPNMAKTLRTTLETIFRKAGAKKAQSLFEIAIQLHLGKNTQLAFRDDVKEILSRSPGPAENAQLAILNLITSKYRNGKMHLAPESPHKFTSREEMQALRKLVLGIVDSPTSIPVEPILDGINKTSWLPQRDTNQVVANVKDEWDKYPGVVTLLWQALGETAKTSAA